MKEVNFNQLPAPIQAKFATVKNRCKFALRITPWKEKRYYITHNREVQCFTCIEGEWICKRTYEEVQR